VVFARFDDDKQTALNGNDVWGALVSANRAVGEYMDPTEKRRKRMRLSEVFVSLLLDNFDRHLTLKDVASSFYKDPRFPLVPNLDAIREVIYDLVQPHDHAGPGTGGWELVGSDGARLRVESPQQLAISSIQQQLRRAESKKNSSDVGSEALGDEKKDTVTGLDGGADGTGIGGSDSKKNAEANGSGTSDGTKPTSYSWYRVEVTNRSITDEFKREDLRAHLLWLASTLDDDSLDHQLITLKYDLMAGTNTDLATEIRARAQRIQANKTVIEEEL
jgi:hypothetical protein